MDIFNTREVAIAIWLAIVIAWGSTKPSVRGAASAVLKTFTQRLILVPLGFMAVYICFIVYGLYEMGLWDVGQLKNTILWSVSVAAVSLFNVNDIAEDPHYFRKAIKDNLKLIAVFEFVVAFYTFSLLAELLIVPLATILVAMQAIAESRKEFELVEKVLGNILALFGVGLVAHALFYIISDFSSFATRENLVDFVLPPVLSLLFTPFLFVIMLYVIYERIFIRLRFAIDDPELRAFAKQQAIINFRSQTELLNRWSRNLGSMKPKSERQIKDAIREVKVLAERERNPPDVPPDPGWSPYEASAFLSEDGLNPGDYHRMMDGSDEWYASSPYLEVGEGILPNNIAYYVEGNETTATTLKLVMNVNEPDQAEDAHMYFQEAAQHLYEKALSEQMPQSILQHLAEGRALSAESNNKRVLITKEDWPTHKKGGYTLKFFVMNADAVEMGASG